MDDQSLPKSGYYLEYETSCLAAHLHLVNFVDLTKTLQDFHEAGTEAESSHIGQARRAAALGIVVFSAVTLEGAINFFGKFNNVPYYKDVEKSLSALNKWRLFPRLAGRPPVKEHVLERIDLAFSLRDRVVHPKPKLLEFNTQMRTFMPQEGGYLLNTIDLALDAIGLDPISADSRIYEPSLAGTVKPDKDIIFL